MKIKLSEATPLQLNWLVAKCEGIELDSRGLYNRLLVDGHMSRRQEMFAPYRPTTDWAQGGPIIDRMGEAGLILMRATARQLGWRASLDFPNRFNFGPTPLIAAMRCYVASKLGDEVEIQEALK